ENVIERIAVRGGALKDGSNPSLSDFASELSGLVMAPEDATKMRTLDDPDSSLQAMRALAEAGGNHMKAARMLGISRTTLWRRLRAASI
ncbi:MAG TPA: helix-turn-helix domain-containing protein, partial [Burkholderiales bacterium]|nr:helix-turn-helix domain-containing protein [Burkholderiales bacterium]